MFFETKPQTLADRVRAELPDPQRTWAQDVLERHVADYAKDEWANPGALAMMRATIAALFGSEKG